MNIPIPPLCTEVCVRWCTGVCTYVKTGLKCIYGHLFFLTLCHGHLQCHFKWLSNPLLLGIKNNSQRINLVTDKGPCPWMYSSLNISLAEVTSIELLRQVCILTAGMCLYICSSRDVRAQRWEVLVRCSLREVLTHGARAAPFQSAGEPAVPTPLEGQLEAEDTSVHGSLRGRRQITGIIHVLCHFIVSKKCLPPWGHFSGFEDTEIMVSVADLHTY